MSMSKKDFIALADALRQAAPDSTSKPGAYDTYYNVVDSIADVCSRANGNFKRDRWLSYIAGECGPNGGAR